MKTQHSTEVPVLNSRPLIRLNLVFLLPVVHRQNDYWNRREQLLHCPLFSCTTISIIVAANMSKSYCLAPHQWRKAVQRYCHFWNWQNFLQLFSVKVINNPAKSQNNWLNFNQLNTRKIFKKVYSIMRKKRTPMLVLEFWRYLKSGLPSNMTFPPDIDASSK